MALEIGGATVGYDKTEVETALKNLHTEAIQDTIDAMSSGLETLRTATDDAWVGTSAERFKSNMQTDFETIRDALNSTYDVLKNEVYQMVNEMDNIDQNVLGERGA